MVDVDTMDEDFEDNAVDIVEDEDDKERCDERLDECIEKCAEDGFEWPSLASHVEDFETFSPFRDSFNSFEDFF